MAKNKENGENSGIEIDADRRAMGTHVTDADTLRQTRRARGGYRLNDVSLDKVVICSPASYADIEKVIDLMKCRAQVIVDFQGMSRDSADKVLNILSGAVYALSGSVKRLKGQMFLLTPYGTEIKRGL
ncbi:MAG: cell division protein SepF [Clostridiaceae bacterium]|jgi:FtsZ-interacting cell division protein YlmF|nr:cell division protein SepF [Clostridiaceae bacterium]